MSETICKDDNCDRPPARKGLCSAHYQKLRRLTLGCCAEDNCSQGVHAAKLCRRHYDLKLGAGKACSVEGCGQTPRAMGLCSTHYYRLAKHGDPGEADLRRKPPRDCKVEGCSNPAVGRDDLCKSHHDRMAQYGNLMGRLCQCGVRVVRGTDLCPTHHRAAVIAEIISGTRKPVGRRHGYVVHKIRDEAVLEHRVIMEHLVGRPLEPFENVHHKNGVRDDNRPENLELWMKPQPSGQRPEDMADWMVAHYRDVVLAAISKTS